MRVEHFILGAIGVMILACIVNKIMKSLSEVESFSDMLGGYVDIRYGKLGGKSADTAGKWIKVASINITAANQIADLILEVYGSNRQTFSIHLSNGASAAIDPAVRVTNVFGAANITFTTATVVRSSSAGLNNTYDVYLQMQSNGTVGVPVAWYLSGVAVSDVVAIDVTDTVAAPSGGFNASSTSGADDVKAQVAALLGQVNGMRQRISMIGPGGGGAQVTVATSTYDTGTNDPSSAITATDDGNYSSALDFSTKNPGALTNPMKSRLRISSSGNVGIGTQAPDSALHVVGNVNFTGKLLNNGQPFAPAAAPAATTVTRGGISIDPLLNSFRPFKPKTDPSRCLDTSGGNTTNGTPLQCWDCNGSQGQLFTYHEPTKLIIAGKSNRCLDSGSGTSGTQLLLQDCNPSSAGQQWVNNGPGVFKRQGSNVCMDLAGGNTANGSKISAYTCGSGDNQKWSI